MQSTAIFYAQQKLKQERKRRGIEYKPLSIVAPVDVAPIPTEPLPPKADLPKQVKVSPSLLMAFQAATMSPVGRLFTLLRAIDTKGRGIIEYGQLKPYRHRKADKKGLLGISWRRIGQILKQGDGIAWTWEPDRQRVKVYNPARVKNNLDGGKLTGVPVYIPSSAITESNQIFKAYAHAALKKSKETGSGQTNPISKATIKKLSSASSATQWRYNKLADVKTITNIAVFTDLKWSSKEDMYTARKEHGAGLFRWYDRYDKLYEGHHATIAKRLPSSYQTPLEIAPMGRQRKQNRQIENLVHKGQGIKVKPAKRYYQDELKAAKATRDTNQPVYLQNGTALHVNVTKKSKLEGANVWVRVPNI